MSNRIHNFSAGPGALPVSVLEEAQKHLVDFHGAGLSVMEMSHRSSEFEGVLGATKASIKGLLNIPDEYEILFLQGGASLQFAMIPINLYQQGRPADVLLTGAWSKKALKELQGVGESRIVASSDDKNFSYIPTVSAGDFNQDASYAYMTSNNTIFGTQWHKTPDTGSLPLVADMSSDILSRQIEITDYDFIFAGAQKNLGPSGVTLVIMKKELADRCSDSVPTMMQYRTHIKNGSLYNTPPTFGIYLVGLVTKWIENMGGLAGIQKRNESQAARLYNHIDESDFYYCPTDRNSRSLMNVVFRITGDDSDLESKFNKEAEAAGLSGLKGHRSVGGLRASIYNAQTDEAVDALVSFMKKFETSNVLQTQLSS
jgi:phosphoserine aminotransferase